MKETAEATVRDSPKGDSISPHGIAAEGAVWRELGRDVVRHWKLLVLLFSSAALLRFFQLGNSELWLDEILVLFDAKAGTHEYTSSAHDLHLNIVGWILNHVGESPFWLRSWSALAGSLAVPVLAIAGLWFGGRRTAVVWGTMAVLHPFLIFYSQDANYYGAMTLFACVQIALYIAFFRGASLGSLLGISVAGALAFFIHPFSFLLTGLALAGCVIGSIVSPSLRRRIYDFNPKNWLRNPAIPLVALFLLISIPLVASTAERTWSAFIRRLAIGQAPQGVEFTLDFFQRAFAAYGVSYFLREGIARHFAFLPFGMFIGGLFLLCRGGEHRRAGRALASLAVLAPIVGFLAIFNMRHHGFYPRYLTYFVPLYIAGIGWMCLWLGERLGQSSARRTAAITAGAAAVIGLIQIPYLICYYTIDRGNFANLATILRKEWKPGELIFIPEKNDRVQADYYLNYLPERAGEEASMAEELRVRDPGERDASRRSYYLHRLYGEKSAWIISAWRVQEHPILFKFLDDAMPPVYKGFSPHTSLQDANLHHWTYDQRVLMRTTATRFTDDDLARDGRSEWLAEKGGRWKVESAGDAAPATIRMKHAGTGETRVVPLGDGIFESASDSVVEVTADDPSQVGVLQAIPLYPEVLEIGPFEVVHYPDDSRNWEREFHGQPVLEKMFDGAVSYVLWVPPGEERQLILKMVRRNEEKLREKVKDNATLANFNLAVACDGVHLGTWMIPGGEEEMIRVPTGIKLPSGNHRLNINGFTFRHGYAPANYWMWGGLEFNRGLRESPLPSMEEQGVQLVHFPKPILSWGIPGTPRLPNGFIELSASYPVRVSEDVVGPSGLPVLEVSLEGELRGSGAAYHTILAPPIAARPGQVLGFSTYIRIEGGGSHAAQLAVATFDRNGNLTRRKIGDQQLIGGAYAVGWRRFIEMFPVPEDTVAVSPGVLIFPPDPGKVELKGRVLIDAFASLPQATQSFRSLNLDPGMFFSVDGIADKSEAEEAPQN